MSAFAVEDGTVYQTYSAYARGLDGLWGMYQSLDRAPRERNEARGPGDPLNWFRRHDEYEFCVVCPKETLIRSGSAPRTADRPCPRQMRLVRE
jgi:hypothetical protein